jgi:hypothetical protein
LSRLRTPFKFKENQMPNRERELIDDRLQDHPHLRSERTDAKAIGTLAVGPTAISPLIVGALAIGALAIGAVAIGRLVIGRARINRLEIDELVVRKLQITEAFQGPDKAETER